MKIGRGGAAEDDRETEEEENRAHQYIPQALWYRVKKQPGAYGGLRHRLLEHPVLLETHRHRLYMEPVP